MASRLFLATDQGVVLLQGEQGHWQQAAQTLSGERITSLVHFDSRLVAGTRHGAFLSNNNGDTWTPAGGSIAKKYIRWLETGGSGDDRRIYAGLEPATILISQDRGQTWSECSEVANLRNRFGWYLPYSDGAGCVRGFAVSGERAYAAVEVGGVLRSDSRGEYWDLVRGSSGRPVDNTMRDHQSIHPDVHSIYVHPTSPDLVCAATGGGFYLSRDGGHRWKQLYDCYCRACWWNPDDPNQILLGPAGGVDRQGRIEFTEDMGESWQNASTGLNVPWDHHMVERFTADASDLYAVLSNGEVIEARIGQYRWKKIPVEGRVNAVVVG